MNSENSENNTTDETPDISYLPPVSNRKRVTPPFLNQYKTNFYGNKKAILPQIADCIPANVKTIADIFSGTGIIAWYLKHQGYRLVANDVMAYPALRLRVLVGNNSTVLDSDDLKLLTSPNNDRHDYLSCYYGQTFGESNCNFLETWAANIPLLNDPVKRDIAVYIPVICISNYLKYAAVHFSTLGTITGDQHYLNINLEADIRTYALDMFPNFVINNGFQNECSQADAIELLPRINADMVLADPPYACRAGCYEGHYSFFDDLVSIFSGNGAKIANPYDADADLEPYTYFGSRNSAITGLAKIFECSLHVPHILVTYNTTSEVSPSEIIALAKCYGRDLTMNQPIERPRPTTFKNRNIKTNEVLMLYK